MGFAISDFWETTPFEFSIITSGYKTRREAEQEEMITQAYMISRLVWAKRLNLKELLNKTKSKEQMTDDAMMKICKALNQLYGGKEVIKDGN